MVIAETALFLQTISQCIHIICHFEKFLLKSLQCTECGRKSTVDIK